MAVRAPSRDLAYVEPWDAKGFPSLGVRISLDDLALALKTARFSVGHNGVGDEDFPFIRERGGFVRYRETVEATADGEVLRGHTAVASAIAESWCADNPKIWDAFESLIDGWLKDAEAADDQDKRSRRREEERLAFRPKLAAALEHNPAGLFAQAGLTAHEVRAMELRRDGKSFAEIGLAFGVKKQMIAERVHKAIEKILALDADDGGD